MLWELASKTWRVLPKGVRVFLARRVEPKFTVSVMGVITNERGEVLLLDHFLRPHSGWGPPGGFIEHQEQPEDALRREIKEETTLELRNIRFHRLRTLERHLEIVFTAEAEGCARVVSSEIRSLGWFTVDNMPGEMALDLQFLVKRALDRDK